MGPTRDSARCGGVLEEIGEPLGPDRRVERTRRADVAGDQRELALDRWSEPSRAAVHERIEPGYRPIETLDRQR